MTNPQLPAFLSEELQKAVDTARPSLEGVDEARNRVSNEIKALEKYLQSLDLKWSFRFSFGERCWATSRADQSEVEARACLEDGGSALVEYEEEALLWDQDGRSEKFRLLYEVKRWEGCLEVDAPGGPWFRNEDTLRREVKPLIETKFEIRKRMHENLPDFLASLVKHLDVDHAAHQEMPL